MWEKGTILENTRKRNKHSLFNPETNIATGTKYLRALKDLCTHKGEYESLVCYNRGPCGAKNIKNPQDDKYVKDVIANAQVFRDRKIFNQISVTALWQ